MQDISSVVEKTFREESGRVLATLIGSLGDFELAEDVFQDALIVALERWPHDGIPNNPGAWITTTARRKAIDRIRRAKTYLEKKQILQGLTEQSDRSMDRHDMDGIPDERLKLIFTCCHPALSREAQVALTLRTLGGLETSEIAKAFLVPVPTMAQRLVRAQRKIKRAGIPYRVPPKHLLPERLEAILTVIYLIFNEGYVATSGDSLVRQDLCREAIRLSIILNELLENDPELEPDAESLGLLALMLLHDSRQKARVTVDGHLILLEDQERSLWNRRQITDGLALVERALHMRQPGPYQIQAAIAALHAEAQSAPETDWRQIAALYGELAKFQPTPVIALNQAVAVAMAEGPMKGLALLDEMGDTAVLQNYHLYHSARADLLRRAGWFEEAAEAYAIALELAQNSVERTFLRRRLAEMESFKNDNQ